MYVHVYIHKCMSVYTYIYTSVYSYFFFPIYCIILKLAFSNSVGLVNLSMLRHKDLLGWPKS